MGSFVSAGISRSWLGSLMLLWSPGRLAGVGRFVVVSAGMTGVSLHVVAQVLVHIGMEFKYQQKGKPQCKTLFKSVFIMFAVVSWAKASQELA